MKKQFNKLKSSLAVAALCTIPFSSAFATLAKIDGSSVVPKILAGGADAVDGAPMLPAGLFTGVVSINIRSEAGSYICTGAVISKRHIITAAHCIDDADGIGNEIDISGSNDVRAVFSDGGAFQSIITAKAIEIHPDYDGFANCSASDTPSTVFGACLNDDIAVLTLSEEIPEGVEIYEFSNQAMDGQLLTMVGHGTSGNGITGDAISPSFTDKRIGFNYAEVFDCDDGSTPSDSPTTFINSGACKALFGNEAEVWYADFDGPNADGDFQNSFCDFFGLGCDEAWLGETFSQPWGGEIFEANIGGGDSGGPSFLYNAVVGKFELVANNTFGAGDGSYGSWFGGNVYAGSKQFIAQFVSAPSSLGIMLVAFAAFALRRRKIAA